MSEMMIFTSLFSTYMRYRQGIPRCDTVFESGDWVEGVAVNCYEPASQLIASSWWHIAPGAINTFALIISSFTIVQALRWAHKPEGSVDEDVRRKRVYRYLGATWCLAVLFLTLKMVEWFIGFHVPEIGFLGIHEHEIHSLYSEGYLINNDQYQSHNYIDEATGAHMMANIRVSATMFYVTTGTHGAHVLGGIVGLTYLTYKAWTGAYKPQSAVSIEYFGLYWHFVDLVWVLVFPFFYLY
jgi:cytochrome c oxidase subunit I+III